MPGLVSLISSGSHDNTYNIYITRKCCSRINGVFETGSVMFFLFLVAVCLWICTAYVLCVGVLVCSNAIAIARSLVGHAAAVAFFFYLETKHDGLFFVCVCAVAEVNNKTTVRQELCSPAAAAAAASSVMHDSNR